VILTQGIQYKQVKKLFHLSEPKEKKTLPQGIPYKRAAKKL